MAKTLILIGSVLVILGIVLLIFEKGPFPGRLPGDILVKRERYTIYFPLASSIILSIVISLILYLFNKFK